jgi:ABC-type nickel/cobalt efflux system permease component RcnA
MNLVSMISLLAFGFALGLKHATEADHLAAVSTIVSDRKSLWSASLVGGLWGLGHTIALFIAGIAVIQLHLKISELLSRGLEFGVALMLVVLGLDTLRKLTRGGRLHIHFHRHGGRLHAHPHIHDAAHANQRTHLQDHAAEQPTHHGLAIGPRPLVVGMIHGVAGSGALMLLVLSTISSPLVGLTYVLVFGIGSIGGMMLMSLLLSLPFHLTTKRFARLEWAMKGTAGLFSVGFGLFMIYQIGFVDGLLGYKACRSTYLHGHSAPGKGNRKNRRPDPSAWLLNCGPSASRVLEMPSGLTILVSRQSAQGRLHARWSLLWPQACGPVEYDDHWCGFISLSWCVD